MRQEDDRIESFLRGAGVCKGNLTSGADVASDMLQEEGSCPTDAMPSSSRTILSPIKNP